MSKYYSISMEHISLICVVAALAAVVITSLFFLPPEVDFSQWGPIETKEGFFGAILGSGIIAALLTQQIIQ